MTLFLGVSERMFLDMISICFSGLSKLCSSVWAGISRPAENLNRTKGRWRRLFPALHWDSYHWFLWFSGLQIQTELWPLTFLRFQPSRQIVGFLSFHKDMSQFLIIKIYIYMYTYIYIYFDIHTSYWFCFSKKPWLIQCTNRYFIWYFPQYTSLNTK